MGLRGAPDRTVGELLHKSHPLLTESLIGCAMKRCMEPNQARLTKEHVYVAETHSEDGDDALDARLERSPVEVEGLESSSISSSEPVRVE